MGNILNNTIVIGLIAAIPSFVLGYLAYRRSVKIDKVTEQSGIANNQLNAVEQIIAGLNQLINNLQVDNKELRENITTLSVKLKEIIAERDILIKKISTLNKIYKINGK